MILWQLFLSFLQVGAFSFGGAYGAIPLIRDVVSARGWLDDEALTHMIAVCESTPGPIMVNMATYVGSTQAGLPGAAVATLAVVLPSFVIILLVMVALQHLLEKPVFQALLQGIKPCVIGIILATGIHLILGNVLPGWQPDWKALALTTVLGGLLFFSRKKMKKGISPIGLICISALLGIAVYGI